MTRKRYNLSLDEDLVGRVDVAAGDVSRSRFVERALEKALGSTDQHDGLRPGAGVPLARGNTSSASSRAPSFLETADAASATAYGPPSPDVEVLRAMIPKPSVCPDHPAAGTTEVRGRRYCAEPGCPRTVGA